MRVEVWFRSFRRAVLIMAAGAKLTKSVRKPSGFQQLGLIWPGQLLLSLLTSLPELVTGWRAAAADARGLVTGNAPGSIPFNLFNITLAGLVRSRSPLLSLLIKGRMLAVILSIIIFLALSLSGILKLYMSPSGRPGIKAILLAVKYFCLVIILTSTDIIDFLSLRSGLSPA
ncbi:MAG: hypothetical protein GX767_01560 [Firmicutes bacterium]|nr:hypothetical protein [Bacillota bacterium]